MGQSYFYPKLRGKRCELGYTLEDMANLLGMSKNCYFRKENGKTDFRLCEVKKILDIFGVEFNDIFFTFDVNQIVDKK